MPFERHACAVLLGLAALGTSGGARADAPSPSNEPKDGSVRLKVSGYVQADAVAFRQSSQDELNPGSGEPLNEDRFLIPRARLRADVASTVLGGTLELDGNTLQGPGMRLVEANAFARWASPDDAAPPYVMGLVGLFKVPFGVEGPERERSRLFLERSTMTRALFPGNYDLGVQLSGGYRVIRYAVALTNGEPVGEPAGGGFFPGRDPNAAKDVLGRLGVDAAPHERVRVRVGFSGLSGKGFHRGNPATKDTLTWRDDNENGLVESTEIRVIPGRSATASENFARFALGADARVDVTLPVLGTLSLAGELVRAQNLDRGLRIADPVALGRDVRERGYYLAVTQELTRWGMLGVRYDRYDPDVDASETIAAARVPRDETFEVVAVAAAFRYTPTRWTFASGGPFSATRVIAEYAHRGNALGRDANGFPTTLADDSLQLRAEVSF